MESEYPGSERRKIKRVRVSLSVIYRVNEPLTVRLLTAEREIRATMLDLSEEGMAILTDYDVPVSTILLMRFTLFRVDKDDVSFYGPLEITGEVRDNVKKDGECRVGIRFLKIEEDDKREVANFAKMVMDVLTKGQQ